MEETPAHHRPTIESLSSTISTNNPGRWSQRHLPGTLLDSKVRQELILLAKLTSSGNVAGAHTNDHNLSSNDTLTCEGSQRDPGSAHRPWNVLGTTKPNDVQMPQTREGRVHHARDMAGNKQRLSQQCSARSLLSGRASCGSTCIPNTTSHNMFLALHEGIRQMMAMQEAPDQTEVLQRSEYKQHKKVRPRQSLKFNQARNACHGFHHASNF
jgi:hypothetical protein